MMRLDSQPRDSADVIHPTTRRVAAVRARRAARHELPLIPGWVSEHTLAVGEEANIVRVHRTSDRTTQIFGQHSFWTERDGKPFGLDGLVTLEGANNLHQHYQSALGALVSRKVAGRAALYAEPIFVINSNPFADAGADNNTLMVGFGGRFRLRPSTYVVAEITPRVAWFDPGKSQVSFGLEGRAGGHLFQINISNGFGTTLGQIANGAFTYDNWYIGFNIARKFF